MKKLKLRYKIPLFLLVAFFLCWGGLAFYARDYYRAMPEATAILSQPNVIVDGYYTIITPENPSDTALIFYPGGKVEHTAYLPILEKISAYSITCILIQSPYNLALFDVDRADKIYDKLPQIEHWYVGGHSLGGIVASWYAEKASDKLDGLVLFGSYINSDYPSNQTITIYGSLEDGIQSSIDYTDNLYCIMGGNHAQFGNYGPQEGDPDPQTPAETQQNTAAQWVSEFLFRNQSS